MPRIFLFLLVFIGSTAYSMSMGRFSSREKAYLSIGSGCLVGAGAGSYAASMNPDNDHTSTVLGNTLIGCVSVALFSWIFHDDDQKVLVQENQHLTNQVEELKQVIAKGVYRPSGAATYLDKLTLNNQQTGFESLKKMINPRCKISKFSLGLSSSDSKEPLYIPVSKNVLVESFNYYVVTPNPQDGDLECVSPLPPFNYLGTEFIGFGDVLYQRARDQLLQQERNASNAN